MTVNIYKIKIFLKNVFENSTGEQGLFTSHTNPQMKPCYFTNAILIFPFLDTTLL